MRFSSSWNTPARTPIPGFLSRCASRSTIGPRRFAGSSWRRSLVTSTRSSPWRIVRFGDRSRPTEAGELRALYRKLRSEEIPHDEAIRLVLARVLVSPAFLYRMESPPPGEKAAPVSDYELASRLSYFLWSSMPDRELREAAASGRLHRPDVLAAQARRMAKDPRVRRLATEFACQWLHIYDFDSLDEKSPRHFPTFAGLRSAMHEEAILFFTDLFQNDGSVLSVLDGDHTFLNEALAKHYGIPGVTGPSGGESTASGNMGGEEFWAWRRRSRNNRGPRAPARF